MLSGTCYPIPKTSFFYDLFLWSLKLGLKTAKAFFKLGKFWVKLGEWGYSKKDVRSAFSEADESLLIQRLEALEILVEKLKPKSLEEIFMNAIREKVEAKRK